MARTSTGIDVGAGSAIALCGQYKGNTFHVTNFHARANPSLGSSASEADTGWLLSGWTATGMDPRTRGRRLDEAIEICKRLWSDDVIEHHGEFYDFEPVQFEPKPVQKPHPPILVGGESPPALRRAARVGNGWVGLDHTPDSCAEPIAKLAQLRAQYGREDEPFELVCTGRIENLDDVCRWEDAGITRLIVAPWDRSRGAIDGMRRLAEQVFE